MILWWAAFTASLGCVWAAGYRVDVPERVNRWKGPITQSPFSSGVPGIQAGKESVETGWLTWL